MKVTKSQMILYAVTERSGLKNQTLAEAVAAAIDGGATFVQLREKLADYDEFLALAKEIRKICKAKEVPFVINDNVDICLACDADGVHVGQDDLEAGKVRELLGPDKIIGVSTHNREEAIRAQEMGADYLGCGAAFVTGTKLDVTPIKKETIQEITEAVDIPVVAIGGISEENVLELQGLGLSGVAVVSALFSKEDVKAAAEHMRALSEQL